MTSDRNPCCGPQYIYSDDLVLTLMSPVVVILTVPVFLFYLLRPQVLLYYICYLLYSFIVDCYIHI